MGLRHGRLARYGVDERGRLPRVARLVARDPPARAIRPRRITTCGQPMRNWRVTAIHRRSSRRLWTMGALGGAFAAVALGAFAAFQVELIERLSRVWSAQKAVLAEGKAIYSQYCARCHGANLEGQPDWRRRLPSGRLPAP